MKTAGGRRRLSMIAAGLEIKTSNKHVEAVIEVVSGRGFDSPRLHWVFSTYSEFRT